MNQDIIDKDFDMFLVCFKCGKPRTQFVEIVQHGMMMGEPVCDKHYKEFQAMMKKWEQKGAK